MLKELYIENLAVIEKANIEFTQNLNVFTGETGAGKSILINGINAVLGQRVTKDIVRTGADRAVISAVFCDLGEQSRQKLDELGISTEEGRLYLTREVSSDGGSIARINSRSVNVSVLRELGETLVNIHGQHDNQVLLSPDMHIHILDGYADAGELLEDYRVSFRALQQTARKINQLNSDANKKTLRVNELREIISAIESLAIEEGEDTRVEEELEIAKNSVILSEAVYAAEKILNGDDDSTGAVEMISDAADRINRYTEIMSELAPLSERLSSAQIELADIAAELSSILDDLDVDPQRYDYLNQRNDELRHIKKKYGPELSDVADTLRRSAEELDTLENSRISLEKLNEEKNRLLAEVSKKAKNLSQFRHSAAKRFISQVTAELEFLNMPNVTMVVDQKPGKLTQNGMDTIEFLISANPGEAPRPIARIASGGELSRIMLALKNVIADKDSIDTLIFDEIDTGVSGRAAQKIGIKLRQISGIRQVLCVTHLAQMAVMADNHLLIEKNVSDGRTVTTVRPLDADGRVYEIARIMGGESITPLLLENARQLIDEAANTEKTVD